MTSASIHVAVLPSETIEYLRARQGGEFLDCTLGGGGHTRAILDANSENTVLAFDRDGRAINRAKAWQSKYAARLKVKQAQFSQLSAQLEGMRFHAVLADLGISSDQLAESRGFSFKDQTALDMRMDEHESLSAHDIIEQSSERDLIRILKRGGVTQGANAVARAIVRQRPFVDTASFSQVVCEALKPFRTKEQVHPATVVFQAIRIEVNKEFEELECLLVDAPKFIKDGGRLVIISFHSLEDRLVTNTMRRWQSGGEFSALMPGEQRRRSLGKLLTRKAATASPQELEANPRSRSARMRVFEFMQQ